MRRDAGSWPEVRFGKCRPQVATILSPSVVNGEVRRLEALVEADCGCGRRAVGRVCVDCREQPTGTLSAGPPQGTTLSTVPPGLAPPAVLRQGAYSLPSFDLAMVMCTASGNKICFVTQQKRTGKPYRTMSEGSSVSFSGTPESGFSFSGDEYSIDFYPPAGESFELGRQYSFRAASPDGSSLLSLKFKDCPGVDAAKIRVGSLGRDEDPRKVWGSFEATCTNGRLVAGEVRYDADEDN